MLGVRFHLSRLGMGLGCRLLGLLGCKVVRSHGWGMGLGAVQRGCRAVRCHLSRLEYGVRLPYSGVAYGGVFLFSVPL